MKAAEQRAVLIDVKTYRLGRSQVATNVKDFVKLHTNNEWINNYNASNKSKAIGALIFCPSTHEWIKKSRAYKECSNKKTPIVMLSYENLAFLPQNKPTFQSQELLCVWDYPKHFPQTVNTRMEYWKVMYHGLSHLHKLL